MTESQKESEAENTDTPERFGLRMVVEAYKSIQNSTRKITVEPEPDIDSEERRVIGDVKALVISMARVLKCDEEEVGNMTIRSYPPDLVDTSFASSDGNIFIHPNARNSGTTYGEECMHLFRNLLEKEDPALLHAQDTLRIGSAEHSQIEEIIDIGRKSKIVQEFFGRIGESLAFRITKKTLLEHLFSGYEPRKSTIMQQAMLSKSKELKKNIKDLNDTIGKLSVLLDINRDVGNFIKEDPHSDISKKYIEELFDIYFLIKEDSSEIVKQALDTFELSSAIKGGNDFFLNQMSDLIEVSSNMSCMAKQENGHDIGYKTAEIYMQQNPKWQEDIPQLIRMTDSGVFNTIINTPEMRRQFSEDGEDLPEDFFLSL